MPDNTENDGNKLTSLIKEYELCWQGIQHNNTRLWTSASIFISGSIVALTTASSIPLSPGDHIALFKVIVIAAVVIVALCLYLNIFRALELLDRIEFYRAEEIEKELGLWRIRYHVCIHEQDQKDKGCDGQKVEEAIKEIKGRLKLSEDNDLSKYKCANKSFRTLIWFIIAVALIYLIRAGTIYCGVYP